MSDRYLDLSKGEADVAFRSGDTDDGRKIADSVWAVYASEDYIARHGKPTRAEDLSQHPLASRPKPTLVLMRLRAGVTVRPVW